MTESTETKIAVLEALFYASEKASAERSKLADARHESMMLRLDQLSQELTASREFSRGVSATVKAAWAVLGGLVTAAAAWFIWGKP